MIQWNPTRNTSGLSSALPCALPKLLHDDAIWKLEVEKKLEEMDSTWKDNFGKIVWVKYTNVEKIEKWYISINVFIYIHINIYVYINLLKNVFNLLGGLHTLYIHWKLQGNKEMKFSTIYLVNTTLIILMLEKYNMMPYLKWM